MKNFLFIIVFLVILTVVIVDINPKMHKTMYIGGAKLVVQDNNNINTTDLKVENKDSIIDKNSVVVKSTESVKSVQNLVSKNVENNVNQNQYEQARKIAEQKRQAQIKKQQESYAKKLAEQKTQASVKKSVTQTPPKTVQESKKVVQKTAQQPAQQPLKTQPKVVVQDKTKSNVIEKKQEPITHQKQLVTEQETIVWNKWRSDIANSIGATTSITLKEKVEIGTTIKYSFDVDKNEQISNIVVSIIKGPTSSGAQNAKSTIYKAIKNLNGRGILTFPKGSNRTSTTVVGAIELSDKTDKINKNMFNDYEIVTRQYYK